MATAASERNGWQAATWLSWAAAWRHWLTSGAAFAAGVACLGIALFSYRYLLAVGPRSPFILANTLARPFLYVHIAGAATALLTTPFAVATRFARWRPALHRRVGVVYMVGCLSGAFGGFFAAFGSTAGWPAAIGFGTLAPLWFWTTMMGWRTARARDFAAHRRWMVRSVALTLAAVTLRLLLPLAGVFGLSEGEWYRALAFLSWLPNLAAAEIWLRRGRRSSRFCERGVSIGQSAGTIRT